MCDRMGTKPISMKNATSSLRTKLRLPGKQRLFSILSSFLTSTLVLSSMFTGFVPMAHAGGKGGGGGELTILAPTNFSDVSGVVDVQVTSTVPFDSLDVAAFDNQTLLNPFIPCKGGCPSNEAPLMPATLGPDGNWHVSWDTTNGYMNRSSYMLEAGGTSGIDFFTSSRVNVNIVNTYETITSPAEGSDVVGDVTFIMTPSNATSTPDSVTFIGFDQNKDFFHTLTATQNNDGTWSATTSTIGWDEGTTFMQAVAIRNGFEDDSQQVSFNVNNLGSVVVTSPVDHTTVSGTISLAATTGNNISSLQFSTECQKGPLIDATGGAGSWSATLDTTQLPSGECGIRAIATSADAGGLTKASDAVVINVSNYQETLVSPTPVSGTEVYGTMNVAATISGFISPADSVQFFLNSDGSSPIYYTQGPIDATYDGSKWVASVDTTQIPDSAILNVTAVATYGQNTDDSNHSLQISDPGQRLTIHNNTVTMTGPTDGATATSTFTMSATVANRSDSEVVPDSLFFADGPIGDQGTCTFNAVYNSATHSWSATVDTASFAGLSCASGNGTYAFRAVATINGYNLPSANSINVVVNLPTIPGTFAFSSPILCDDNGRLLQHRTCSEASGVVPLHAVGDPGIQSVTFSVNGPFFWQHYTFPATLVNGVWTASWDTIQESNGFGWTVIATAQEAGFINATDELDDVQVNNVSPVTGSIVFPLTGSIVNGTVNLVGRATACGQFQIFGCPTADSVTFYVTNKANGSSVVIIPATYDFFTGNWNASWDAGTNDSLDTITMQASAFGFATLQTSVDVGVTTNKDLASLTAEQCSQFRGGGSTVCSTAPVSATNASTFEFVTPSNGSTASSTIAFQAHIVPSAVKVTLQLFSIDGKETDIPMISSGSGTFWLYTLDTSKLPDGTYYAGASASYADGTPASMGSPIHFLVHNSHQTANTTFSVSMSVPSSTGSVLLDGSFLEAKTTKPVQSLYFELTGSVSPADIHAVQEDASGMLWAATFNADNTLDGTYLLNAVATTGTQVSQSTEVQVTVDNQNTSLATSTQVYDLKKEVAQGTSIDAALGLLNAQAQGVACTAGQNYVTGASTSVYYCGLDGQLHVYPNARVYFSWFADFKGIQKMSPALFSSMTQGIEVNYPPGTKLFKTPADPKTYTIDYNSESVTHIVNQQKVTDQRRVFVLRWIKSENVAIQLFGADWAKKVVDVVADWFNPFKKGVTIQNAKYTLGSDIDQSTLDAMNSSSSSTR